MTKQTAAQQTQPGLDVVVEQDNASIQALIDKLEQAENNWQAATERFDANLSPANTKANDEAIQTYYHAADELARYLGSLWKTGYRLTRE